MTPVSYMLHILCPRCGDMWTQMSGTILRNCPGASCSERKKAAESAPNIGDEPGEDTFSGEVEMPPHRHNVDDTKEYCKCAEPIPSKRCEKHPDQHCDQNCELSWYCTICLNEAHVLTIDEMPTPRTESVASIIVKSIPGGPSVHKPIPPGFWDSLTPENFKKLISESEVENGDGCVHEWVKASADTVGGPYIPFWQCTKCRAQKQFEGKLTEIPLDEYNFLKGQVAGLALRVEALANKTNCDIRKIIDAVEKTEKLLDKDLKVGEIRRPGAMALGLLAEILKQDLG